MRYKDMFNVACGALGSLLIFLFGPWNGALSTLIILMAIDYITGLICAGVFKKAQKPKTVRLNRVPAGKGSRAKG